MERERSFSRRQFATGAAAAAAAAAVGRSATAEASRGRNEHVGTKPNVLFIIADDLGYGDLGAFGHPEISTPNLDKLARQGVKLESAYSSSAVCSPTRVGWITGRYPGRLPVGTAEPLGYSPAHRALGLGSEPTLPGYLKEAGYRTGLFGKWHLGNRSPVDCGFDEYWGILEGGADYLTHNAFLAQPGDGDLFQGTPETDGPGHLEPTKAEGYLTDLIADKAIDFLRRQSSEEPFYLGVHFTAPHWPWEDRDDHEEAARINDPAVWNGAFSLIHSDGGSLEKYYEMVRIMDENIGRILGALRRRGLEGETLVIFTSDNGGERFSYNWPYANSKGSLNEGGIRVPGIIRWPGRIRPGRTSAQALTTMDLTASVLTAAGVRPSKPLDGRDILGIVAGREREVDRKLFWRIRPSPVTRPEPIAAVRDGNLKYLRTPAGVESLFDLEEDPSEQANLARLRSADLARLRADWEAWNGEMVAYPPVPPPPPS